MPAGERPKVTYILTISLLLWPQSPFFLILGRVMDVLMVARPAACRPCSNSQPLGRCVNQGSKGSHARSDQGAKRERGKTGRFLRTPKAITATSNVQIHPAGTNTVGNLGPQILPNIAAKKA